MAASKTPEALHPAVFMLPLPGLQAGMKMLSRLTIEFSTQQDFSYRKSSNMHGLLMQLISPQWCEKLHSMQLTPCSQYLEVGERKFWHICGLTREAYDNVIQPVLNNPASEYRIDNDTICLKILDRNLKLTPRRELVERFYDGAEPDRILNLEFLSPTAFKSNGRYVNLPDLRLIFQSWMNRFSATSDDMQMFDQEALQQLADSASVTRFRLRSMSFPLEKVAISGFAGSMTVRMSGSATMGRYARLLAEFGQFSGVGIKTFLGMGAVRLGDGRSMRIGQTNQKDRS